MLFQFRFKAAGLWEIISPTGLGPEDSKVGGSRVALRKRADITGRLRSLLRVQRKFKIPLSSNARVQIILFG